MCIQHQITYFDKFWGSWTQEMKDRSLTRHDFVTIFGKYTDICRTSKCGHISLFNIKKPHLLITISYFLKICRCWEAVKLMVANSSFPKFRFLSENLNFTTGNRYCQLFTWRVSVTSFIFRKIPANTQIWITIIFLSIIPWSENYVPWTKQLVQGQLNHTNDF